MNQATDYMNEPRSPTSQAGKSWDTYWQGSGAIGAYARGGAAHPAIKAYWAEFFNATKMAYRKPAMLDIASGNGPVVEQALEMLGDGISQLCCVDVSEAAINNIQSRFPTVKGVVADARSIPLDSGAFDIITSQFGIEYAGLEAVEEADRLLAGRGRFGFLMHIREGSIHRECMENLEAVSRVREAGFVERAKAMFEAGFAAVRGADRAAYDTAGKQLAPAISELESILDQYGKQVADGSLAQLYGDVARIHGEIQHYEPEEVLGWLSRMSEELEDYAGRMSSMRDAALDEDTFKELCNGLHRRGWEIETAGPFQVPDEESPLAWALIARK